MLGKNFNYYRIYFSVDESALHAVTELFSNHRCRHVQARHAAFRLRVGTVTAIEIATAQDTVAKSWRGERAHALLASAAVIPVEQGTRKAAERPRGEIGA